MKTVYIRIGLTPSKLLWPLLLYYTIHMIRQFKKGENYIAQTWMSVRKITAGVWNIRRVRTHLAVTSVNVTPALKLKALNVSVSWCLFLVLLRCRLGTPLQTFFRRLLLIR